MPKEKDVYTKHADRYDRLIQREDYQQNILKAIQGIIQLEGLKVVDIGAGTGRLTRILAPHVKTIAAMDLSLVMIDVAQSVLQQSGVGNWSLAVGDNACLPVENASADLVVSGWSFCYLAVWGGDQWRARLQTGLDGIRRVLHKGGTLIILETMGTGFESPNPPPHLDNYFHFLKEAGFSFEWIRTDYQFASQAEAEELSEFFFGDELTEKVRQNKWVVLPECTGVWWMKF
jgi:ubiquinone/menaquinone biosynthesis C-methylase UbiE